MPRNLGSFLSGGTRRTLEVEDARKPTISITRLLSGQPIVCRLANGLLAPKLQESRRRSAKEVGSSNQVGPRRLRPRCSVGWQLALFCSESQKWVWRAAHFLCPSSRAQLEAKTAKPPPHPSSLIGRTGLCHCNWALCRDDLMHPKNCFGIAGIGKMLKRSVRREEELFLLAPDQSDLVAR